MPITQRNLEIRPNQTVIEQGVRDHGFFILQSGALEVYKDEVLLTTLMYPGTIFGEMGDILNKPRTCTVRAKGASVVTHVQADSMDQLIRESPEIALKLIKTLASRLERTTQKLADATKEIPLWQVQKQTGK